MDTWWGSMSEEGGHANVQIQCQANDPSNVEVISIWYLVGDAISEGPGEAEAHSSQVGYDVCGLCSVELNAGAGEREDVVPCFSEVGTGEEYVLRGAVLTTGASSWRVAWAWICGCGA